MLNASLRWARNYGQPKALVLLYHRVAQPEIDPWDLAVAPAFFEQQLQVLQRLGNVISGQELVERLQARKLKRRSVVLTFDDGYQDNFLTAKPLLEQYQLPATFFIVSGSIQKPRQFWSDELADIFLGSDQLPPVFSLTVGACHLAVDLSQEQHLSDDLRQRHQDWKAADQAAPTTRATLYYRLWQLLKPLPDPEQQQELKRIRAWAGREAPDHPAPDTMPLAHVQQLSRSGLFTLGAHTQTHPALTCHSPDDQRRELVASKQELTHALDREVTLLAYPYGDCNRQTSALAHEVGFQAAFTTEPVAVDQQANLHRLGRFHVKNWDANPFRKQLERWFG